MTLCNSIRNEMPITCFHFIYFPSGCSCVLSKIKKWLDFLITESFLVSKSFNVVRHSRNGCCLNGWWGGMMSSKQFYSQFHRERSNVIDYEHKIYRSTCDVFELLLVSRAIQLDSQFVGVDWLIMISCSWIFEQYFYNFILLRWFKIIPGKFWSTFLCIFV